MTTTPQFNVGDTVRRKAGLVNDRAYQVGTQPFEVKAIKPGFIVDKHGKYHAPENLELVETGTPAPAVIFEQVEGVALGKFATANWPTESIRDRHLDHIAELDAVIRRRNATIASRDATIEKQKAQLAEYAAELDTTGTLDKTAGQLGLSSDDAVSALEVGAWFNAIGYTRADVNFWSGWDRSMQRRMHDRRESAS